MKKNLFVALPIALTIFLTGCGADTGREAVAASDPGISSTVESTPSPASPSKPVKATKSAEAPKEAAKPKATAKATTPSKTSSASSALNALKVAEESGNDAYDRDLFNHWTKNNGSGCDTRFAVLVQESTVKTKISGCKVISGNWFSVYDDVTVTDPKKLDIDHMVPLKEAWGSGASGWDANTREAYANDMDYAESLVAVTAGSNRSKSDRDPADWLPNANNQCDYVSKWISVKTRWNLAVDAKEKAAIEGVLSSCDNATVGKADEAKVSKGEAPVKTKTAPKTEKKETAKKPSAGKPDPQFKTCKEAVANGYGNYSKGDAEYDWYQDRDKDGKVCES